MTDQPKDKTEELVEQILMYLQSLCRQAAGILHHHHRAAAVLCIAAALILLAGYVMPRQVTVHILEGGQLTTVEYKTTARTVEAFIEQHGLEFNPGQDAVDADLQEEIRSGMELTLTRAFDVELTADGQVRTVRTLPVTVEEFLNGQGVVPDGNDLVEPSLETVLEDGDKVKVTRIVQMKEYTEVTEDFEVIYEADPAITIGDVQLSQKGRKGKIRETYDVIYADGVEVSRQLAETTVLKKTRDKIYRYGTKIDISPPEGLKYKKKYDNVRAVSYYFSGSPHGAYGLPCEFGTVAVDKNLIPLGSLLYIEGYGYAIANDVGSSIKGKTVDLYMEKYEQCLLWGARWTTVYVISEP